MTTYPNGVVGDTTPLPAVDPVARWRTTPAVISQNPADPNFRLDAKHYESIQLPTYNQNDPARLVTYTDAEKQAQRVAGAAMKQRVLQAASDRTPTLTIEPGVYRFPADDVPIQLEGAKALTIVGYGAELVLEGFQQAVFLRECEQVTIVGFTVDRDPYRHTQFTVLEHDWDAQRMTVRVMEGYEPEDAPEAGDMQFFADDGTWRRHVFTHYTKFAWIDKAQRIGVYSGVNPVEEGVKEWLVGTLGATILHGGYHVFQLRRSVDCHFVDIVNYGGAMMANGWGNSGLFYFLRNKDMPRPGTNSLIAGGFGLVEWVSGGAVVEDGVYCRTNDDAMDIVAWNSGVYKQEAPNTLVAATMRECPFTVGDTLFFFDAGTCHKIGEAKVTGFERITDPDEIAAAERVMVEKGKWIHLLNKKSLTRVVLDTAVTLNPGDLIENYSSFRPEHIVLKNNLFHDVFCRVLIQGSKATTVEGNVFLRNGLAALLLCNEMGGWVEGKTTENVTIRGNAIVDSPWSQYTTYGVGTMTGAISIGDADDRTMGGNTSRHFRNILIEDNDILRPMFSGILVKNVDGLVIRGNRIDSPVTRAGLTASNVKHPGQGYYGVEQDAAILLFACSHITVEENEIRNRGAYCKQDVVRLHCD